MFWYDDDFSIDYILIVTDSHDRVVFELYIDIFLVISYYDDTNESNRLGLLEVICDLSEEVE